MGRVKRQTWCPSHMIRVTVRHGVVRLEGTLFEEVERRALHVLTENVHGVWAVDDRMVCIEPMSGVGPSERAAQVATFP